MAHTWTWMTKYGSKILKGEAPDWEDDTIKIMILDNGHTPAPDTDEFIDDVSGDEVSGTGYTAGGATLDNAVVSETGASGFASVDADDETISTVTFVNGLYLYFYKDTGTPATSPIMGYVTLDVAKSPTADDFLIQFDAVGVLKVTGVS